MMFKQFYLDIDRLHAMITPQMRQSSDFGQWQEWSKSLEKLARATADAYPSTLMISAVVESMKGE